MKFINLLIVLASAAAAADDSADPAEKSSNAWKWILASVIIFCLCGAYES